MHLAASGAQVTTVQRAIKLVNRVKFLPVLLPIQKIPVYTSQLHSISAPHCLTAERKVNIVF
jgi:hypothetical protein